MGISRRAALKALVASGVGLGTGAVAYGMAYERHRIERIALDLPITGLPLDLDGLRIGLITDVHHSSTVSAEDVAHAVTLLAEARPDIVVLGGDYVSFGDRAFVGPVAELLAPLADAPLGSFAVLGNHDDDRDMPAELARHGFVVLKDQRTSLVIKGETLDVAGIRFWTRGPAELARVLEGTGGTTLLLAHDPRRLVEAAAFDAQLVLSGHTHGGQVVLPGIGAVAGRKFPVLAGIGTEGNATVYVSRGVGTVYVPVRINCPPEVTVLTLRTRVTAAGAG
ncbi:MAG TPA: metallophosphoesterase [Vicinamibacterales bacterium]|nr:metallophosphoesterase [Vicinamibacterales bacterium]